MELCIQFEDVPDLEGEGTICTSHDQSRDPLVVPYSLVRERDQSSRVLVPELLTTFDYHGQTWNPENKLLFKIKIRVIFTKVRCPFRT